MNGRSLPRFLKAREGWLFFLLNLSDAPKRIRKWAVGLSGSAKADAGAIGCLQGVAEIPWELCVLHAHRPRNEEKLKLEYNEKALGQLQDTFILYRIIGNDLYPRHAKGQSRQNVRFILENEPELADCEKRWVVNRIFDAGERQAIIELLEQHEQPYLEIPFEAEAFAKIGWDYSAFPEPGFLSSAGQHYFESSSAPEAPSQALL